MIEDADAFVQSDTIGESGRWVRVGRCRHARRRPIYVSRQAWKIPNLALAPIRTKQRQGFPPGTR